MHKVLVFVFGIILIFSCSNPLEKNSEEYAAGEVGFHIVDSVDFDSFYAFIKCFDDLQIKSIIALVYHSTLPEDSSEFIQSKLTLPYLKSYQLSFSENSNSCEIIFHFQNFKPENEISWAQLKSDLSLTHHNYGYQIGLLKVPEGDENYWVRILSESYIFEWVNVNTLRHTCIENK